MTTNAQIEAFLACKRIGIAGVSTNPDDFSRTVFREFVARGYDAVPIHPTATEIEGRPAFASPIDAGPLDAVYVMTPANASESVVRDCYRAGIRRVWLHHGLGRGADEVHAIQFAKSHGMGVIAGECALMFLPSSGAVHRAHGAIRRALGHYPDFVETPLPHRVWRAVGYGVLAWAVATWLVLAIGGIFAWDIGLASRLFVIPAAFGFFAWLNADPGRLPPLASAALLVAVGIALDAAVLCALIERSFAMFASATQLWIPYALAFAVAVILGTRHHRPIRLRVLYTRAA